MESIVIANPHRLPADFVYLDEAVPGVLWDAKYATDDNFTGAPVPGYAANRVACSDEIAQALLRARDEAARQGYKLLIWDAARPQRAVDAFVRWGEAEEDFRTKARHYPGIEKAQMFELGYIAKRSGHTRGCAVDLTLIGPDGAALDMGGGFDLMDERSHHGCADLTAAQKGNRERLCDLMTGLGLLPYESEWWHYSLAQEPYPHTYFDFVIE